MAFNWQTFRVRTISSLIFVAVMLGGLLWNQWSFLALFSIIHFGCWWEYLKLTEKIHQTFFHPYTKLGLMVMGYGLMLWFCGPMYEINGYGIKENISLPVSAAGFAILIIGIFQKNPIRLKAMGMALVGLFYISLSWGLMISLHQSMEIPFHDTFYVVANNFFPITIIVAIWMNDTMAYLTGSLIGRTPLTRISPKKTWEGTIGGIVLCVVIMAFLYPFAFSATNSTLCWITGSIALVTALFGTLGDLLESKLKRMANVKDSGSIMPGHGGFLDRFDSLLVATTTCWVLLKILLA
jgi:phosphatidate cytidylyltransferase